MVSILGLDKAQVLKALWENSKAQGMSFLALPQSNSITVYECAAALSRNLSINYFAGKVIKTDFSGDSFDAWDYDRDNGEGAAQRAVDSIRK